MERKNLLSNIDKTLNYTTTSDGLFTIMLGDFNARLPVWWTKTWFTRISVYFNTTE